MDNNKTKSEKANNQMDLDAKLRTLPKPRVPEDLEAKLLTGIHYIRPVQGATRRPLWKWGAVGIGIGTAAACLIIFLARETDSSHEPLQPPVVLVRSEQDLRRVVAREATSARLLAVAKILDMYPGGKADAAETREYIARAYADTSTARQLVTLDQDRNGDIP